MRRLGALNHNRPPELAHLDAPATREQRNYVHLS
jgi:hypothetical protein